MNRHGGVWRTAARPLVAVLLALCLVVAGVPGLTASVAEAAAPSVSQVRSAADLSAGYMQRSVLSTGKFRYLITMDPYTTSGSYNILRHAGSTWAMCDHYQSHPTSAMRSSIGRATTYLRDKRIRSIPGRPDLLAVVTLPEDDGEAMHAPLGGTGLGLVALTSANRIKPGFTKLSTLQGLGRFVVAMQRSDGSFYTKYIPSRGRVATPVSQYYPGEAALGMLMLYEQDPNPAWLRCATKALTYLAQSRVNATDPPADHWALIATQKLLSLPPNAQVPVPRQLLLDHVVQISDVIVDSQLGDSAGPVLTGSWGTSGRTTPAATRLEALQAALATLPEGHAARPRIRAAVDKGIAFLLRNQVTSGTYAGAFPGEVGADDVRIDYVQHSLSAMLRYVRLGGISTW